jgi:hypothetical protein
MNIGENSELKFIAALGCYLNQTVTLSGNFNQQLTINSVQLPGQAATKNYIGNYSGSTPIQQIKKFTKDELQKFCKINQIKKSANTNKADVYINGSGISTKYIGPNSDPAIVNHTNRTGWENIASLTSQNILNLDPVIADYWNKRKNLKIIQEDIKNSDPLSPFRNHRQVLEPYLEFFCFDGSGRGKSKHPAVAIIEYTDPFDPKTWTLIYKNQFHQYLLNNWNNLRFSMRSKKGMPKNGTNSVKDAAKKASMQIWTELFQEEERGALHIRLR